jgi:hypothetical protein
MSEYQYFEWLTIDRTLTPEEQAAVSRLSSHIDVTSSNARVTYQWGDFKHDPKQVLAKYFDAHLFLANWGSRHLMFRFPNGLLDTEAILGYCVEDFINLKTIGDYQLLSITLNEEEGGGWVQGEGELAMFSRLRDDLLQGDYRLLYLAWLKAIDLSRAPDDDSDERNDPLEPAVPMGLKHLPAALGRFVKVFEVIPLLVEAAAETSPDPEAAPEADYGALISRLPRGECDDFLIRVARGETGVALALRKRLMEFAPKTSPPVPPRRTIHQLFERARQLEKQKDLRRQEQAQRRHTAEMKALARNEVEAWQEVEELIQLFNAKGYDEATEKLGKLQQLAEFQGSLRSFQERMQSLRERFRTRRSLMERWQKKRLG